MVIYMYKNIKEINDLVEKLIIEKNININSNNVDDFLLLLENELLLIKLDNLINNYKYFDKNNFSFCCAITFNLINFYLESYDNKIIDNDIEIDEIVKGNFSNNFLLYLNDIKRYPLLNDLKQRELIIDYKKNNNIKSKELLICSNQRMIIKYALYKTTDESLLLDLIQEGNIGFIKAIEKYDINYDCKLTSYAFWEIKRNMDRMYHKNRYSGTKSFASIELQKKIYKFIREYYVLYNIKPTEEEIIQNLNITKERYIRAISDDCLLSLNDFLLKEAEESEFIDFLEDKNDLIDECERKQFISYFLKELKKELTFKRYTAFNKVLGLEDDLCYSFVELAKEMGVTKQAIQQAYVGALKNINNNEKIKKLILDIKE